MASQAEAVSGDRPSGPVNGRVPWGGQGLALATLCTLLFLTFLDNTVVSVALGYIQVDLKANVSDLQWVVGAYALTFASIMLACGMIGDEDGRVLRKDSRDGAAEHRADGLPRHAQRQRVARVALHERAPGRIVARQV